MTYIYTSLYDIYCYSFIPYKHHRSAEGFYMNCLTYFIATLLREFSLSKSVKFVKPISISSLLFNHLCHLLQIYWQNLILMYHFHPLQKTFNYLVLAIQPEDPKWIVWKMPIIIDNKKICSIIDWLFNCEKHSYWNCILLRHFSFLPLTYTTHKSKLDLHYCFKFSLNFSFKYIKRKAHVS